MFKFISFIVTLVFTLPSALYAIGAGVCPVFDDGTVLLGKEMRHHGPVWSDFGGGQDPNESIPQSAFREFKEETAHYTFPSITLAHVQNAPYADHIHQVTGNHYRMYFLWIHGQKPTIQSIHQNAALAHQNLGHHAHVEKNDWKYFNAQLIMNAHNQNGNLPGTNEPLYGPMKAVIRTPAAQQFFANYINAVNNLPAPPAPAPAPAPGPAPAPVPVPAPTPQQWKAPQVIQSSVKVKKTRRVSKRSAVRVKKTRVSRRSAVRVKHTRKVTRRSAIKRSRPIQRGRRR